MSDLCQAPACSATEYSRLPTEEAKLSHKRCNRRSVIDRRKPTLCASCAANVTKANAAKEYYKWRMDQTSSFHASQITVPAETKGTGAPAGGIRNVVPSRPPKKPRKPPSGISLQRPPRSNTASTVRTGRISTQTACLSRSSRRPDPEKRETERLSETCLAPGPTIDTYEAYCMLTQEGQVAAPRCGAVVVGTGATCATCVGEAWKCGAAEHFLARRPPDGSSQAARSSSDPGRQQLSLTTTPTSEEHYSYTDTGFLDINTSVDTMAACERQEWERYHQKPPRPEWDQVVMSPISTEDYSAQSGVSSTDQSPFDYRMLSPSGSYQSVNGYSPSTSALATPVIEVAQSFVPQQSLSPPTFQQSHMGMEFGRPHRSITPNPIVKVENHHMPYTPYRNFTPLSVFSNTDASHPYTIMQQPISSQYASMNNRNADHPRTSTSRDTAARQPTVTAAQDESDLLTEEDLLETIKRHYDQQSRRG